MSPVAGIRVTVVSREVLSPYSGMLPGHVAGFYDREAMHFDLAKLANAANARFIHDEVVGLGLDEQSVQLAQHPAIRYDLVSLNLGGAPLGVSQHVTPVKPIGSFLPQWHSTRAAIGAGDRVIVVGGGAGGAELALAMRTALPEAVSISVVCTELLPGFTQATQNLMRQALVARDIDLVEGFRVASATGQSITSLDGDDIPAEHIFWVTGVSAPSLLRDTGLSTDDQGFVVVNEHLQSISHPNVFAAGDVACLQGQQRPKSGVFAVREGPVLADNLIRFLLHKSLRRYRAQEKFLVLIGTGNRRAIASRGDFATEGRWVWWWKNWIDTRFMKRFSPPPMPAAQQFDLPKALLDDAPDPMRCGGCGAKLGASPLLRALARLPDQSFSQVALGIGDDAALVRSQGDLLLTVDGFRSLVSDPYLFGRITAHHSLNDILAMGGRGVSALALATVPLMAEAMMEEDLYLMLQGAVDVLNPEGIPLVGGHSAEGAELSLALTISGELEGRQPLSKAGLIPGQTLILSKGLGTGVLLAAAMRGELSGDALGSVLTALDTSNVRCAEILLDCAATAVTDVSGFGLAGHLSEMTRASGAGAEIQLDRVPALPEAVEMLAAGISSSLHQNNAQALRDYDYSGNQAARAQLLVDPQTAGGMLAAIPGERVQECLARLHEAGYVQAAAIGRVTSQGLRLSDGG